MSSATYYFCVQPFHLWSFLILALLCQLSSGFLIYIPNFPSLSELVEPTSRFYWSFSSALGRWFRGWRPPKINTTGELGLGRAGGTSPGLPSPLRLLPSTLRPSLTFKSCYIHMPFNTQIHKYTNTQMLCCNVNFYIVFVSLSCISYLYWLYLYFMHIWLTVI